MSLPAQGLPEQEPNDGPATAQNHLLGAQSYGELGPGDEDWFRFFLPQAADVRLWTAPGIGAQAGDTRLALFDHSAALLQAVDDGSQLTHGSYSLLEEGFLAPGTYYVQVRGFDGQTTGSYTLDLESLPPGQLVGPTQPATAIAESSEPNDPRLSGGAPTPTPLRSVAAGAISVGARGPGFTTASADYDFYELVIQSPGLLTLATSGGPVPTAADTVLHVCDAAFQPLAIDDDGGPGFYSLLRYQVQAAGTYFAVVSDYGAGNYALDVDFAPTMPSGPALTLIRPGGCGPSNGVPRLGTRLASGPFAVRPELPIIGTTYYVDLTNVPPSRLIARLYNLLPRTPGLALGVFGAPGCVSEVDDPVVDFSTTDAQGNHFWAFPLPADPLLMGLPLEKQVAVLDSAYNSLGIRLSNRVTSIVGVEH
ncbi:MAG: DVUA0089 family protein [bacterium]|nr:DVUA0089 family protein [bacterium]